MIKREYVVQKRNVLNEFRANNMSLQELRFFSIYLSKINKDDLKTRLVRFFIDDFQAIMELGRIDMIHLKNVVDGLLSKVIYVPIEDGRSVGKRGLVSFTAFQLFKECSLKRDEGGAWYVEIDAHDKALDLMFEYQKEYFSYKLWNFLPLKSVNQLRMYEILKQFQKAGCRILTIDALKNLLGIGEKEYPRFGTFKTDVLDVCQRALKEHTDIEFTYEPYERKGLGGKIYSLKFLIKENKDHADAIALDSFIDLDKITPITVDAEPYEDPHMEFFMDAFDQEFSPEEVRVLIDRLREHKPQLMHDEMKIFHHLYDRYNEMKRMNMKSKIKDRYSYVKSLMGKDL